MSVGVYGFNTRGEYTAESYRDHRCKESTNSGKPAFEHVLERPGTGCIIPTKCDVPVATERSKLVRIPIEFERFCFFRDVRKVQPENAVCVRITLVIVGYVVSWVEPLFVPNPIP